MAVLAIRDSVLVVALPGCTTIIWNLLRLRRFFRRSRGHLHPIMRKTGAQWGPPGRCAPC